MKKNYAALFLLCIILVVFMAGCSLTDTKSIEDRISDFISDIPSSSSTSMASAFKKHCHPDSAFKNESETSNEFFGATGAVSKGGISGSGNTRTVTINGAVPPTGWIFEMKEDGTDNWFINSIHR